MAQLLAALRAYKRRRRVDDTRRGRTSRSQHRNGFVSAAIGRGNDRGRVFSAPHLSAHRARERRAGARSAAQHRRGIAARRPRAFDARRL